MALSNLQAGNSKGVDTSVKFGSTQNPTNLSVNGLVSGSSTQVQFTVSYDPANFTCALSKDLSQVVVTFTGPNKTPGTAVYTVDTGINEKTAQPGSVALAIQAIPTGQSSGTTFTFTKSTGGGGRPRRPARTVA
ncbi:MAG TPA: hypothetical protein PLB89_13960 [Flavobacteriales bacterium]|jgi:hypothetical protein|nr:hypothetical protein [Flavobacteriales bacterium]